MILTLLLILLLIWSCQDKKQSITNARYLIFFLINILLFLAKYKHFTAFYTYTNLSDDLQILNTVSYLETRLQI